MCNDNQIPTWATQLKAGDNIALKDEVSGTNKAREAGVVTEVFAGGVAIDFFCDVFGDPDGLPSIEFYEWSELEPP